MTTAPQELANLGRDQVDRLREFLAQNLPEGPNLDYKLRPAASLARTVAAMANADGGVIVIGVDEDPKHKTPIDPGGIEAQDIRGTVSTHLWRYLEPVPPHRLTVVDADHERIYGVLVVEPSRHRAVLHTEAGVLVRHGDMSVAPSRADFEGLLAREADRRSRIRELEERRAGDAGIEALGVHRSVTVFAFMDAVDPVSIAFGPEVDLAFRGAVADLFEHFTENVTAPGETVIKGGPIDYFRLSDSGDIFCRYHVNRSESARDWPPEGPDAVRAIDLATDLVRLQLIPFELAKRDESLVSLPMVVTAGVGGYADKALITNMRHEAAKSTLPAAPRIVRLSRLEQPEDAIALARRIIIDVGRALQVPGAYDWTKGLGRRVVANAEPRLDAWKSVLDQID